MKPILVTLSLLANALIGYGQTASITLEVTNVEQSKGNMSIALFKSAEGFPSGDQFIVGEKIPVSGKSFAFVLKDIPSGNYAIAFTRITIKTVNLIRIC